MSNILSSIKHETRLMITIAKNLYGNRKRDFSMAATQIESLNVPNKKALQSAYKHDYKKYRITFSEYYFGYHFNVINETKKKEYLSMRIFQSILLKFKLLYREQWRITGRKECFLKEYSSFIKRKWMLVDNNSNKQDVAAFLEEFDVIAKPTNQCSGKGVFKIKCGEGNADEIMNRPLPILLEQCIYNVDEIAEFHPASLNTVRILTVSNGKQVSILGAVLRTGNHNSVFDNADSGGYFAEIDVETGVIISNGVNEQGDEKEAHPASGKVFKGFLIPNWQEVVETCKSAALYNTKTRIIAWDIAITPGGIDIIEANSIPTISMHQIPLQKGIRNEFFAQLNELGLKYKDAIFWTKVLGIVF